MNDSVRKRELQLEKKLNNQLPREVLEKNYNLNGKNFRDREIKKPSVVKKSTEGDSYRLAKFTSKLVKLSLW